MPQFEQSLNLLRSRSSQSAKIAVSMGGSSTGKQTLSRAVLGPSKSIMPLDTAFAVVYECVPIVIGNGKVIGCEQSSHADRLTYVVPGVIAAPTLVEKQPLTQGVLV